jgi:hypothetical protein
LDVLAVKQDLLIGLYNPVVTGGGGVTEVLFDVFENGNNLVHQDFNSAAAAQASSPTTRSTSARSPG